MLFLLKVMYIGENAAVLTFGEKGQQQMLYVILDFTHTKPSCWQLYWFLLVANDQKRSDIQRGSISLELGEWSWLGLFLRVS